MPKKNKGFKIFIGILIAVVLLSVIGVVSYFGFSKQTGYSPTFTPVYCNDYEFTCCKEQKDFQQVAKIPNSQSIKCPDNANKCEILSSNARTLYVGSQNCRVARLLRNLYIASWTCDDEQALTLTYPLTIKGGQQIYSNGEVSISYNSYSNHLVFCGRSGCDIGVPVSGADGCSFQTNKDIYDTKSGSLLKKSSGTISYTVNNNECVLSYQQGDRHICGNFEEQCSSDNDCGGHTYGTAECSGRTVQQYGCTQLKEIPTGIQNIDGEYVHYDTVQDKGNYNTIPKSRCDIKSAKQVQCCGDTDCGSDSTCDNNPASTTAWTCRPRNTVQCTSDIDCGVSQQCNINKKEMEVPYCTAQKKCDYKKVSDVKCCSSSDCATGYFCDSDKTCKQSSNPKTTCQLECCQDEEKYFDKPCGVGATCKDNKCIQDNTNGCKHILQFGSVVIIPNIKCLSFFNTILWIVTILLTVFTFFEAYTFTSARSSNPYVNWIVSITLAIGIGLLVFLLFWWGVLIFILFTLLRWLIGALIPENIRKRFK